MNRIALTLVVVTCSLTSALPAGATSNEEARAEARQRFDRGLTLFNQGDTQGALAEFHAAYGLTGNSTVLYNIARVQAAGGDPVAALSTIDKLLAAPGDASPARLEQLRALRQEQLNRVGSLTLRSNVVGPARLEVDGTDAGVLELDKPLLLAAGRHVIGVLSPGYHPRRVTVLLAGLEQKTLELTLEPLEGALGQVRFDVEPIGVSVSIDGQELGKSPNLVEVAVSPGPHRLVLERPGYVRVERDVHVPEGAALSITERLRIDPNRSATPHAQLTVRSSEDDSVVFLDGVATSEAQLVRLPAGPHRLRVERSGFVPSERIIELAPGQTEQVSVTLAPTPQYRADYAAAASSRRAWALGIGIGGVAAVGAGGGFLLWNSAEIDDAEAAFRAAADTQRATCSESFVAACTGLQKVTTIRKDDLGQKRDRQIFGWVGVGVGAAALATGVVLWATGNDPRRYEPTPESDVFGSLQLAPWLGPHGARGLVANVTTR